LRDLRPLTAGNFGRTIISVPTTFSEVYHMNRFCIVFARVEQFVTNFQASENILPPNGQAKAAWKNRT